MINLLVVLTKQQEEKKMISPISSPSSCFFRGVVAKMKPELKQWTALVLVVATTGNGDAPENMERFWRFIKRRTQPKDLLEGLPFTVLGLGDTNYDKFW